MWKWCEWIIVLDKYLNPNNLIYKDKLNLIKSYCSFLLHKTVRIPPLAYHVFVEKTYFPFLWTNKNHKKWVLLQKNALKSLPTTQFFPLLFSLQNTSFNRGWVFTRRMQNDCNRNSKWLLKLCHLEAWHQILLDSPWWLRQICHQIPIVVDAPVAAILTRSLNLKLCVSKSM